jgi:non-heme chloroperoxidase
MSTTMVQGSTGADDGVRLAWRAQGDPGAAAVLFVHGWMMSGAVWDAMLPHVRSPSWRVVVDLRGTGMSDAPNGGYSLERYAADVLAVADAARLERFVLVGHSMGGQIAQLVAARTPDRVRGLALYCPVPASGMQLPPDAHGLFRGSAGNRELQGTILDLACKELSATEKERLLGMAGAIGEPCIQGAYDAWTGGFHDPLDGVRAPAMVVATSDPFLPADFLQAAVVDRLPAGRLAVLPGPGHYVPAESPAESAALLDAFLAGVTT